MNKQKHVVRYACILAVVTVCGLLAAPGVAAQAGIDLDKAVKEAAALIDGKLPAGNRVALVNLAAPSSAFSEHLIFRLESALMSSGKLIVAGGTNLDNIRAERGVQLAGAVSDSAAMDIGKRIGATAVITGSIVERGDGYRLTLQALIIKTAMVAVSYAANLPKNVQVTALMAGKSIYAPAAKQLGVPDFVNKAYLNAAEDVLLGVGTYEIGSNPALISHGKGIAETRARADIARQLGSIAKNMVNDYTAASELDPYAAISFHEDITQALALADLKDAQTIKMDIDANGVLWVVMEYRRSMAAFIDAAFNKAVGSSTPAVKLAGVLVPGFVNESYRNASEDVLIGIGAYKAEVSGDLALISPRFTMAETRARADIARQMNVIIKNMITDYAAASGITEAAALSFQENISQALARADLKDAKTVRGASDYNGVLWMVMEYSKAAVAKDFNAAQSAAKLAVPAARAFDALSRMDAAFNKTAGGGPVPAVE